MVDAPPEPCLDEAGVPAYVVPDPLVAADGSPVRGAGEWPRRRTELLALFERHVYGRRPATRAVDVVVASRDALACGGLATRLELAVTIAGLPSGLRLCCWIPNAARGPCPAFLGLNFGGNHAVHSDRSITLSDAWIRDGEGLVDHRATEASRGQRAHQWPVEMILSRGYALATAFYGDLAADRPDVLASETFAALGQTGTRASDGFGAISLWAWTLSRALDALTTIAAIDARRVAVVGLSRLGKVALWAGATDQRFALTISTNSGQGGAALGRRRFGETIRHITTAFPHWFCPDHATWADREHELPVDQHELLALIAPRPVYVASATRDLWADPHGELLSCLHADPVYRLLGTAGLGGAREMPPAGISVGDAIGYHLRAGVHDMVAEDWWHYLAFADRWLESR